jgi:hypothetical protein
MVNCMLTTGTVPNLAEIRGWLGARECHEERGAVKQRVNGYEWIFGRQEFSTWISQDHVQLFWVHGFPGCGKTYLYSKLLEHISSHQEKDSVYFFFCAADRERVSVSSLLRSWTFQLIQLIWTSSHSQEVRRSVERRLSLRLRATKEATPAEVFDLCMSLLNPPDTPSCFLTVDALDECEDWREFFRLLPQIPTRFKVLLTSHEFPDSQEHLQPMTGRFSTLTMTPDLTQGDIDAYLCDALAKLKTQNKAEIPSHVKLRIQEKLREADGMFLWVRLMIEDIQTRTSVAEITRCLDELPRNLTERYDRIMAHVNNQDESSRLLAHKVFFWVLTATRPLSTSEFCAALAVRPARDSAGAFDPDELILGDAQSLISRVCGSFIRPRGDRGMLYSFHATVTQYLRQYMAGEGRMAEVAACYQLPHIRSSDALAAAVCMRFLSSDVVGSVCDERFEVIDGTEAVEAVLHGSGTPPLEFVRYAATRWLQHVRHVEDGGLEQEMDVLLPLAKGLFGGSRPNLDFTWRLYWFSDSEAAGNDVDDEKLGGSYSTGFSALHIAAYFGLRSVVRHLLQDGQDPNVVDDDGRTPLRWAAARGHADVVKMLIEGGANV